MPLAPYVLRPYQRRYIEDLNPCRLLVKSRRIGMTYADACEAAITAALAQGDGGMDTWYSAQTADDTREYVEYVRGWAHKLGIVAQEVDGSQFLDPEDATAEGVWAVRFASGHKVVTMTSNPRSIHGKQGRAVLDEAARYDRPDEFLEAALPLLMLGGRVSLISTESHTETLFHRYRTRLAEGDPELSEDWSLHECFFDQALAEGFYRWHVMPRQRVNGQRLDPERDWTPELEQAYRAKVVRQMGDHADSQLFGIPVGASDVYLDRATILGCMHAGRPVLRWTPPRGFLELDGDEQTSQVHAWLASNVGHIFAALDSTRPHVLGQDYGRSADITVLVPAQVQQDLRLSVPFVLELRDTRGEIQETFYRWILDRLPRLGAVAMDAGGQGHDLAERIRVKYGRLVRMIRMGPGKARPEKERPPEHLYYSEMFPPLKSALQEQTLDLPSDADHVADLMGIRLADGVPRVPPTRAKGKDGGQRHCDYAVALALALWAAQTAGQDFAPATPSGRRRVQEKRGIKPRGKWSGL